MTTRRELLANTATSVRVLTAGRAALRSGRLTQVVVITVVVATVSWLALVPLGYLGWATLLEDGRPAIGAFQRAFAAFGLGNLAFNSMVFSVGATVLSLAAGSWLAFLTERSDVPFRQLIYIGALAPLIIPAILYTIAWVFVAAPGSGVLNQFLEGRLGVGELDVYSLTGMTIVQGLDNASLAFLFMVAAFRSTDPSLEEAALMGGATIRQVLRRITVPLAIPALAGAALLLTVRNLETFETPAILGMPTGVWVFTSRIWRILNTHPVDYGQAGAWGMVLLVLSSAGILLYGRLSNRGDRFQTVSGKGFRPRRISLGRWRWPMAGLAGGYLVIALLLPLFMLLWLSIQPYVRPPSLAALDGLTLKHYGEVITSQQVVRAFRNSVTLGVGAATVVMLLTGVAAWVVVKTRVAGRWTVDNLTFVPLAFPGLVLGVALLVMYLRLPLPIYGTLWILLIAYCTRFIPYGMRYAVASMIQVADDLDESARTSGASWFQVLRRIMLPLIAPGLMAGWIYVLIVSSRELSSSILLYRPGSEVMSIVIWEMWENAQLSRLSALGVLMITALSLLIALALWLTRKTGLRGIETG